MRATAALTNLTQGGRRKWDSTMRSQDNRRRRCPHSGRRSFSLIELLVVIGVITILISILIPVLSRARRRALVLACPIAFIGDDGGVYLTSPTGSAELRVTPPGWVAQLNWLGHSIGWNPAGQQLAFQAYISDGNSGSSASGTGIVEPMSGQARIQNGPRFAGWVDSNRYIGEGAWSHSVLTVGSSSRNPYENTFRLPDDRHYDSFAPVPPTCNGGSYVASVHGDVLPYIGLIGADFMPKRPIYTWPPSDTGRHVHVSPQVDPSGQWVAWTHGSETVAVHSLREHSSMPPSIIRDAEFCDWTEDSKLLVTQRARPGDWRLELAVLEIDGTLIRKIPTEPRPQRGGAAYRKYWHR
jgi:hypothetical protein